MSGRQRGDDDTARHCMLVDTGPRLVFDVADRISRRCSGLSGHMS